MEEQRARARMGTATAHGSEDHHGAVLSFASAAPPSRFVGYEKLRAETSLLAVQGDNGRALVKLEESPFYAEGGGQVADSGEVRWEGGTAHGRRRLPDRGRPGGRARSARTGLEPGARVEAEVDHVSRFATMRNHTATHLLHAALRERLGTHVRQAGSAVRPDKLRFDFTHGAPLSNEELKDIGDRVNDWIKESHPVRALEMSRMEAERLGAMALFGEKYGDWVRVVEVEDVSRELCGGTHVPNTAAIGIFAIASEGSSAANVRRIEALTGPAAIDWFRSRSRTLSEIGRIVGSEQDPVAGARRDGRAPRGAGGADQEGRLGRPLQEGRGDGGHGPARSAGSRSSSGGATTPTSARCSTSPTGSSHAPARRPSSSAAPPTARWRWSPASARRSSSAGSRRPR